MRSHCASGLSFADGDRVIVCPGQAGLFLLENLTQHGSKRQRVQ
jgi:hypothetical protein